MGGSVNTTSIEKLFFKLRKYIPPLPINNGSHLYAAASCASKPSLVINLHGTFEIVFNRLNKQQIYFARKANMVITHSCAKESDRCKTVYEKRLYAVLKFKSGKATLVGKPKYVDIAMFCKCM